MVSQQECMTVDEILHEALKKETQARDFYADLATRCSVDFMTEFERSKG